MKRIIALLLGIFLLLNLAACGFGKKAPSSQEDTSSGKSGSEQIGIQADLAEEGGTVTSKVGVSIDFTPGLNVPEDASLTVSKQKTVTDDEMGATYTAYDISMGDVHDLGGFVCIRIPYDAKGIEAGQDPEKCVAGMYLNEETGEWESVLYDVDVKAKELVIHTDHFSTYGCFVFKNEGKRSAQVTDIHEWMLSVDESRLAKALQEVIDNGGTPDVECRELLRPCLESSFEALGSAIGATDDKATVAGNLTTLFVNGTGLGEVVGNSEWANGLTTALSYAGIATAVANLSFQAMKEDKTRNDIMGMYKSAMYLLGSASQSAVLGTVGASVWVIDKGLTDIGEYAYNKIAENTTKAYRQYYSKYMTRSKSQWRRALKDIARSAIKNKTSADTAIMDEIDRWCNLFWEIDSDTYTNILIDVDQKGRGWPDDDTKKAITADYKGDLLRMLQPVLEEVESDLQFELWREQQKCIEDFRKRLNASVTFEITEDAKEGRTKYAGYTVAFGPLSKGAVTSDWQFTMSSKGSIKVQSKLIAYLLVGRPDEIRLYPPDADLTRDEPEKTVKFKFSAPKTVVSLGDQTGKWVLTNSSCEADENKTYQDGDLNFTFDAELYRHVATYRYDPADQVDYLDVPYYASYECTLSSLPEELLPGKSVSVSIEAGTVSCDMQIHGIHGGLYCSEYSVEVESESGRSCNYGDHQVCAGDSPGPGYGWSLDAPWVEGSSDTITVTVPEGSEDRFTVFRIIFDSNAGTSWFEYTWSAE